MGVAGATTFLHQSLTTLVDGTTIEWFIPCFQMSEEQLKAFITKVQSDASLQEQLKAEGADPIAIAKAAGFTIKQQDVLLQASELSDDELESISGGTVNPQTIPLGPFCPGQQPTNPLTIVFLN